MGVKFTNNASTTLTSAVAINDATISVADASSFPDISSSGYYYVTIDSEVIKVTSISGTTLTIVAATAVHTSGSGVEIRVAAEILEDIRTETTYTAGNDISITSNVIASTYSHPSGVGNEHLPTTVSQAEAGYLDGVTSSIQTQMNTKASTGKAIAMAMVFG